MEILVFHQHFKLFSQAGSSRMFKFAKGLSKEGYNVTIITGAACRKGVTEMGLPVRKEGLISYEFDINNKIKVISLIDFYDQKLSFILRLISFGLFAFLVILKSLLLPKMEVVFASSTPLSIALPGLIYSKLKKCPFVFEIRDLWPEAPIELGVLKNKLLICSALALEKIAYQQSCALIGISKGICRKLSIKAAKKVYFIPNAVDEEFFDLKRKRRDSYGENKQILDVVYIGSCGYNNAIEIIFKVAEKVLKDADICSKVRFTIVGDGPALKSLKKNKPENMILKGKLSKKEAIEFLIKCDMGIFSQRKVLGSDLKKDSLGNKFFDFIGASLPIIAGVEQGGEMALAIERSSCGIVVDPEDVDGLYNGVRSLVLFPKNRKEMSVASANLALKYTRKEQTYKFITLLKSIGQS